MEKHAHKPDHHDVRHQPFQIPATEGGLMNVIIEIPAGSIEKKEHDVESGAWALDRVLDYLPYPVNYGFLPCTLAGDGDPLDVLFISNSTGSGTVVRAFPIGIMRMMDGDEEDDKILAIAPEGMSPMSYKVKDVKDLEANYHGILDIIRIFFSNYKGPGKTKIGEFEGAEAAQAAIELCVKNYHAREGPAKKSRHE